MWEVTALMALRALARSTEEETSESSWTLIRIKCSLWVKWIEIMAQIVRTTIYRLIVSDNREQRLRVVTCLEGRSAEVMLMLSSLDPKWTSWIRIRRTLRSPTWTTTRYLMAFSCSTEELQLLSAVHLPWSTWSIRRQATVIAPVRITTIISAKNENRGGIFKFEQLINISRGQKEVNPVQ